MRSTVKHSVRWLASAALGLAVLALGGRLWSYCSDTDGGVGDGVVNNFDNQGAPTNCALPSGPTPEDEFGQWANVGPAPIWVNNTSGAGSNYVTMDGGDYGAVTWDNTLPRLVLGSAGFLNNTAGNWSAYDTVGVYYATNDSNAAAVFTDQYINDGSALWGFRPPSSSHVTPGTPGAADWRFIPISLGYAFNQGMSLTSITSYTLRPFGVGADCGMGYDKLMLVPTSLNAVSWTAETGPNTPVDGTTVTISPFCYNKVCLSWPAPAPSNHPNDGIDGFHVYRSTSPTGPWSSNWDPTVDTYVSNPGTGNTANFCDTNAPYGSQFYYLILPYNATSSFFKVGGVNVDYGSYVADPFAFTHFGVNEMKIDLANPAFSTAVIGPAQAALMTNPIPTPALTVLLACSTPFPPALHGEVEIGWNPVNTAPGCNTIASYYLERADDAAFTTGLVGVTTTSDPYNDMTANPNQIYYYHLLANDGNAPTPDTSAFSAAVTAQPIGTCPAPSNTFTVSPSATESFTDSPTFTSTPTWTPTNTPTFTPTYSPTTSDSPTQSFTFTNSPTFTPTPTSTDSPTSTPTPTDTPSNTFTSSPTPTITETFTNSPTATPTPTKTPVPPGLIARIWPNPVSPDKGELLHIGFVVAGAKMRIYNMVGELVYNKTLLGDWQLDGWDCRNNNGIQVVTGVYFMLISGDSRVYKFSVLRENR
jgi:hypothetical protein